MPGCGRASPKLGTASGAGLRRARSRPRVRYRRPDGPGAGLGPARRLAHPLSAQPGASGRRQAVGERDRGDTSGRGAVYVARTPRPAGTGGAPTAVGQAGGLSDGRRGRVAATCLVAWEVQAPAGVKPLQWRLLTNREASTFEAAAELIEWYR